MTVEFPAEWHGRFRAIFADPAWPFKSWAPQDPDETRSPERHYRTMEVEEICEMPVRALAARDSHLFLCVPGPLLREGFLVMDAWGYRYSAIALTWVKLRRRWRDQLVRLVSGDAEVDSLFHVGTTKTTLKNTELVLLGRRGNARRRSRKVRELIVAPTREHSRKPDEMAQRVEEYCEGPYLELFARVERRPGWTLWGDEVGKFRS